MAITGRGSHEIADSVEQAVVDGELAAGAALPPIRELAGELGVNPNTVAAAYRLLRDRGLVETGGRRGTRVRARPASAPRETEPAAVPPGARDAANGNPDPRLLPDLAGALATVAQRRHGRHPLYGEAPVVPQLHETARAIFDADGVRSEALIVTSGALDGIDRVLRSSLRPGDTVALEDPGWPSEYDLITMLGLKRVPVRVDDHGPVPDDLERALRGGARAAVLTNRAQNPTGSAITAERAERLRSVLTGHPHVLTIEDDHGFGITDQPFRSVHGAADRWAVVRSVAKSYGPDLRLAMLTGDPVTADRVRAQQQAGPGWVSQVLQEAFVELYRRGDVDPQRIGRSYTTRREALIEHLHRHGMAAHGGSGVNLWVPVTDEAETVTRLVSRNWATAPGRRFRVDTPPGIRVTVSALEQEDMPVLAADIAAAARIAGPPV